jgi:hypothetical protein
MFQDVVDCGTEQAPDLICRIYLDVISVATTQ